MFVAAFVSESRELEKANESAVVAFLKHGTTTSLHKIVELLQRPLSKLQKARRGALASPRRGERHPPPSPTKADAPKVDTAAFLFAPSGRCHWPASVVAGVDAIAHITSGTHPLAFCDRPPLLMRFT